MTCSHDHRLNRNGADGNGKPCDPSTAGLLFDLSVVAQWIRPIGKEANEIEQIDERLILTEAGRIIAYGDGEWEAIRRQWVKRPTREIMRETGYSRSMVKYLKCGKRRPFTKDFKVTYHRDDEIGKDSV